MNRTQFIILILTMPLWLGMAMLLWAKNPLLILIPCGVMILGVIVFAVSIIYAAELRTHDDWDLVIRSILYRLGFKVAPPKSLMNDVNLSDPEHWHDHHDHEHHTHDIEKDVE